MAQSFNIRNIPGEVNRWVKIQRDKTGLTQQQILVGILQDAANRNQLSLFQDSHEAQMSEAETLPFQFIDLFAGIGGMRIGLERVGGRCVYSCEWNKYAQKTYAAWFGDTPAGDIRKITPSDIPFHHVLAAGFPCQPFSIAGVSKKKSLGMDHGFKDATQGTMFFHLATIIELKRPPVLLLENVKNLRSHDGGKTWKVIYNAIKELDYIIFDKVIDAVGWVPQHRERVFIVGFDRLRKPTARNYATFSTRRLIAGTRFQTTFGTTFNSMRRSIRPKATASVMAWPTLMVLRGH